MHHDALLYPDLFESIERRHLPIFWCLPEAASCPKAVLRNHPSILREDHEACEECLTNMPHHIPGRPMNIETKESPRRKDLLTKTLLFYRCLLLEGASRQLFPNDFRSDIAQPRPSERPVDFIRRRAPYLWHPSQRPSIRAPALSFHLLFNLTGR
jgi:hypothetical protein